MYASVHERLDVPSFVLHLAQSFQACNELFASVLGALMTPEGSRISPEHSNPSTPYRMDRSPSLPDCNLLYILIERSSELLSSVLYCQVQRVTHICWCLDTALSIREVGR